MKEPLVTVGIPTRRTRPDIYKAIDSALNQTYKNIEVLVVDDSGEPQNERITALKEFYKNNPKVRVFHRKENGGIGAARKTIVNEANGDYLGFLSADDRYCENFVEDMLNVSKRHPNAIIYSDYYITNSDGQIIQVFKAPSFTDKEDFIMSCMHMGERNMMFVTYNTFAPTKLWKENNFDEKWRFGEDLEHLLRCILVNKVEFVHLQKPLFYYMISEDSTTSTKVNQIAENNRKIREHINKLLGKEMLKV